MPREILTEPEVCKRVVTIVTEHLCVMTDKVVDTADLVEDLGADSLDKIELVMACEEEFGIEILDSVASDLRTVGDVVAMIFREQTAQAA